MVYDGYHDIWSDRASLLRQYTGVARYQAAAAAAAGIITQLAHVQEAVGG